MFMPHALCLKEKGFKCILMDLPGHGSRHAEALTLENSIKAIKEALELCLTKNVTIIGGSLGGYILM
jgi:pimeloyl-ACP methyl ester carboxylesterase